MSSGRRRTQPRGPCIQGSARIRIPFHDVDPACVVWHGNYFKYFEAARTALLDELAYGYAEMAESRLIWPVVELSARFTGPITFDQVVVVTASLREWEYRLRVTYDIRDTAGVALGRGETLQVPVEMESRAMVFGTPQFLIDRIEAKLEVLAREQGADG